MLESLFTFDAMKFWAPVFVAAAGGGAFTSVWWPAGVVAISTLLLPLLARAERCNVDLKKTRGWECAMDWVILITSCVCCLAVCALAFGLTPAGSLLVMLLAMYGFKLHDLVLPVQVS